MKSLIIAGLGALLFSCGTSQQNTQGEMESIQEINTDEPHRLQFHFTPPSAWMNDPNGMVYHNGEYHLFYQHNPDSTVWGPMHWGHAVSKDLVHWEHLPIALYPDELGTIFSGSAVVDIKNTSGLGTAENPPMVAIFTYHNAIGEQEGRNDFQTQGIAFSLDNGRSWTKYEGNPVLPNPGIRDFRDPKVMWYEEDQKWIMALAVQDHISFYSSPDLKDWKHESDFGQQIGAHGGVWECPDLFQLSVEQSGEEKWVLLVSINPGGPNGGSATQYFVGDFDGTNFQLDKEFQEHLTTEALNPEEKEFADEPAVNKVDGIWIDYGTDNYAGVTWSDVPEADGRRLFMGWMSNWLYANVVPTESWRSAMTVARTLTLENTEEGLRVISKPVKELEKLRINTYSEEGITFSNSFNVSEKLPFQSPTFEIELEVNASSQQQSFTIELSNEINQKVLIGFDAEKKQYFIDRREAGPNNFSPEFPGIHYAPKLTSGNRHSIRLFVDVASVELFADGGKTVMTDILFPEEVFTKIRLTSKKDIDIQVPSLKVHNLKSIYKARM